MPFLQFHPAIDLCSSQRKKYHQDTKERTNFDAGMLNLSQASPDPFNILNRIRPAELINVLFLAFEMIQVVIAMD